ncbi:MAG: substrate-binding domain-containing protein [Verrucomicrobia bacterium]|nr:substrate-binding domain-containing protein [Verrucomicrobiota bacterium]
MPQCPFKPQSTTLYAVAKATGVSHQTVSRVVNGSPHVAERTRDRVLKAIKALNYHPNQIARQLVRQRSRLIGVISYGTRLYGPGHVLTSVDKAARDAGYQVLLTGVASVERCVLREATQQLLAHRVAGILVNVPLEVRFSELEFGLRGLPFLTLDACTSRPFPTIQFDHRKGSYLITRHLLELGHRRLAYLAGDKTWVCGRMRWQGWIDALAERRLHPGPSVEADWSSEGGYTNVRKLLADQRKFTAVVAANDQLALGAIAALKDAGVRVPAQVSVTGFDDMPEARFFRPALTTVRIDFEKIGELAVRSLLTWIEQGLTDAQHVDIAPELIVRDSSAAPGSDNKPNYTHSQDA